MLTTNPPPHYSPQLLALKHYGILMWRNFLLRRRKPILLAAELLTPLIIPLILLALRSRVDDVEQPNCYHRSISMPSMGLLSYVQSMMCNFRYACHPSEPSPFGIPINQTSLIEAYEAITVLVEDPLFGDILNRQGSINDLANLSSTSVEKFTKAVNRVIPLFNQFVSLSQLPYSTFPSERINSSDESVEFLDFNLTTSSLDRISEFSSMICGTEAHLNDIGQIAQMLKKHVVSTEQQSTVSLNSLRVDLKRSRRSATFPDTKPPNEAQWNFDVCETLRSLFFTPFTRPYVERLTFFFFGIIYYYPSTELTDEIIRRATGSYRLVDKLYQTVRLYQQGTSPALHKTFGNMSRVLDFIGEVCQQLKSAPSLYEDCRRLQTLASQINPREIISQVDNFMFFLEKSLACSSGRIRLFGLKNEDEFHRYLEHFSLPTFPPAIGVNFSRLPSMDSLLQGTQNETESMIFEVVLRKIEDTHEFRVLDRFWTPEVYDGPKSGALGFISGAFLDIQESLGEAILSLVAGLRDKLDRPIDTGMGAFYSNLIPGQQLKLFPSPCFKERKFILKFGKLLPTVLLFIWMFPVMIMAKHMVEERGQRIREFTRIMGVSNQMHWLSYFSVNAIILATSSLILSLLMRLGNLLPSVNFILLLSFFLSYTLALMALTFLTSSFFSQSNLAAMVTAMVYLILFLPLPLLLFSENILLPEVQLYAACLSCQVAFGLGLSYFLQGELRGEFGVEWVDFWYMRHARDHFSFGKCFFMLWIDVIIYFALAWYIDQILPRVVGTRKPCYFLFTKAYWCTNRRYVHYALDQSDSNHMLHTQNPRYFEAYPRAQPAGVCVRKMTKRFPGTVKPVLDNLSLNFHANQITSLLGHNGAGKSTLISILTGMQSPTSGEAFVAGHDVSHDTGKLRSCIGFCPQYSILYEDLTVAEHIRLYASLRGIPNAQIATETTRLVEALGFAEKRDCRSNVLSGGQKRKLSVAIAFIGSSPVVFLDEPTAGVDPYSRRSIWDFIMQLRFGRTIILTTHYMDEADILGDHIAIISHGKLKCHGSGLFLRTHHGHGYHLILQRNLSQEGGGETASVFKPHLVLNYLRHFMPEARLVQINPTELVIQLPSHYAHSKTFENFFRHIQPNESKYDQGDVCSELQQLGILSYGVSDTSLEEIFLKISHESTEEEVEEEDVTHETVRRRTIDSELETIERSTCNRTPESCDSTPMDNDRMESYTDHGLLPLPATRNSLLDRVGSFRQSINSTTSTQPSPNDQVTMIQQATNMQQIHAMFSKRWHYFRRTKRAWILEFLLPVTLLTIALFVLGHSKPLKTNPPMPIHPWWMASPTRGLHTFYENNMYAYADPNMTIPALNVIRQVAGKLEQLMVSPRGLSEIRCILERTLSNATIECNFDEQSPLYVELSSAELQTVRNSSQMVCVCVKAINRCPIDEIEPPMIRLQTKDTLHNLTGYNVTEYLLKTRDEFIGHRYGGISFIMMESPQNRRTLEIMLNPENMIYQLLAKGTASENGMADRFWGELANSLRLMLPPTHHYLLWVNEKGHISAPGYLNLLQNLQLRMLHSQIDSSSIPPAHRAIVMVNHPVDPVNGQSRPRLSKHNLMLDISLALFLILALSFIPSSLVTFLVVEVQLESKCLQYISGLRPHCYWLSVYLWDIANYCLPAMLCVLVLFAFDKQAFISREAIGPFILLLLFYGLAVLPMLYPLSLAFSSPSTALVVLVIVNVIIGSITVLATFLLDILGRDDESLIPINTSLKSILLLLPQYCFGRGMYDLTYRFLLLQSPSLPIQKADYENPWNLAVVGDKLIAMGLQTIVFASLSLLLIDNWTLKTRLRDWSQGLCGGLRKKRASDLQKRLVKLAATIGSSLPDDVKREQQRVSRLNEAGELKALSTVSALNVTKFYAGKKEPAVNQISFAIHPAECFGLLGLNGAGKTTTFRMLTSSLCPTFGVAYVNGYATSNRPPPRKQGSIGFCPQYDALLNPLTVREHLTLYARLRGIANSEQKPLVQKLMASMDLSMYADKQTGALSGGNRRKVSTAIAILGNPQVVFLDEPTSGMDPMAKRFVWNQISRLTTGGSVVVLTSHSMEECEILCNRLGIMVNGQFRCLGSVQHLKNRFGNGYIAEVRIAAGSETGCQIRALVKEKISSEFTLNNQQTRCHEYQFPRGIDLANLFSLLNSMHARGLVEEYSVKQTTLDQVFVNFARVQMRQLEEGTSGVEVGRDGMGDGHACEASISQTVTDL